MMFCSGLICWILVLLGVALGGVSEHWLVDVTIKEVSSWWGILVSRNLPVQLSVLLIVLADVVKSQIKVIAYVSLDAFVDWDRARSRWVRIFFFIFLVLVVEMIIRLMLVSICIIVRMINLNWLRGS